MPPAVVVVWGFCCFHENSKTPTLPVGKSFLEHLVANVLYPMSTQCLLYRKTCGRLVEDLPRLVNDIRYGSFIIVGLRGKLQKASGHFFLTMSFFAKRGKKTCKNKYIFLSKEKEK